MERRRWAPFPDSRGGGPSVQAAWLEGRLVLLWCSGWPLGGSLSPLCSLPSQLPTHLGFSRECQGAQPSSNLLPEALPCAGDGPRAHRGTQRIPMVAWCIRVAQWGYRGLGSGGLYYWIALILREKNSWLLKYLYIININMINYYVVSI